MISPAGYTFRSCGAPRASKPLRCLLVRFRRRSSTSITACLGDPYREQSLTWLANLARKQMKVRGEPLQDPPPRRCPGVFMWGCPPRAYVSKLREHLAHVMRRVVRASGLFPIADFASWSCGCNRGSPPRLLSTKTFCSPSQFPVASGAFVSLSDGRHALFGRVAVLVGVVGVVAVGVVAVVVLGSRACRHRCGASASLPLHRIIFGCSCFLHEPRRLAVEYRLSRKRLLSHLADWLQSLPTAGGVTGIDAGGDPSSSEVTPVLSGGAHPSHRALEGAALDKAIADFNSWFAAGCWCPDHTLPRSRAAQQCVWSSREERTRSLAWPLCVALGAVCRQSPGVLADGSHHSRHAHWNLGVERYCGRGVVP